MNKNTRNYLFTQAVDCLDVDKQFQFGFNNDEDIKLNFFDKIFFYNVKGICVNCQNINLKNSQNIFENLSRNNFIKYMVKYLIFYSVYALKLKLNFFKDIHTFIYYDNILKKNRGIYFKIFEFSKQDYIFEILANKYKISFIYNLHSLKTLDYKNLKYLENLKHNKNMKLFIIPSIYHLNYFENFFDSNKIYLSKYHGNQRIQKNKNLVFKPNNKYLILLNGDNFDNKLIKIAKTKFKGDFVIKPHPFHYNVEKSLSILTEKDIHFSGIVYNNTSSVVRLEYLNVPKYFIRLNDNDKDLLEELDQIYGNNSHDIINKQKQYIKANFYHKSSKKNLMDVLNENINS